MTRKDRALVAAAVGLGVPSVVGLCGIFLRATWEDIEVIAVLAVGIVSVTALLGWGLHRAAKEIL